MPREGQFGFAAKAHALSMAVLLSIGLPVATAQQPATIEVSSAAELMSALGRAAGGDTVLLQPGDYGN